MTSASGVPSLKVMPLDTATASVAPAAVVPPVTFGVPSGWQRVFTLVPPFVPCPAFTATILSFLLLSAVYIIALPESIAAYSAYFHSSESPISALSEYPFLVLISPDEDPSVSSGSAPDSLPAGVSSCNAAVSAGVSADVSPIVSVTASVSGLSILSGAPVKAAPSVLLISAITSGVFSSAAMTGPVCSLVSTLYMTFVVAPLSMQPQSTSPKHTAGTALYFLKNLLIIKSSPFNVRAP